jgi:hypothetical protein
VPSFMYIFGCLVHSKESVQAVPPKCLLPKTAHAPTLASTFYIWRLPPPSTVWVMVGRDPPNMISEMDILCYLVVSAEINLLSFFTTEAISCGYQESIYI